MMFMSSLYLIIIKIKAPKKKVGISSKVRRWESCCRRPWCDVMHRAKGLANIPVTSQSDIHSPFHSDDTHTRTCVVQYLLSHQLHSCRYSFHSSVIYNQFQSTSLSLCLAFRTTSDISITWLVTCNIRGTVIDRM